MAAYPYNPQAYQRVALCPECKGQGRLGRVTCPDCDGAGCITG